MADDEHGSRQIKIILIALGIFMFIALVGLGYRVIMQSSPQIMNNCVSNAVLKSVENTSDSVISEESARATLEKVIRKNATFLYNTLDVCDVRYSGYVYLAADNLTYAVCGNGQIYRYYDMCAKKRNWGSLASMLNAKNANIVLPDK